MSNRDSMPRLGSWPRRRQRVRCRVFSGHRYARPAGLDRRCLGRGAARRSAAVSPASSHCTARAAKTTKSPRTGSLRSRWPAGAHCRVRLEPVAGVRSSRGRGDAEALSGHAPARLSGGRSAAIRWVETACGGRGSVGARRFERVGSQAARRVGRLGVGAVAMARRRPRAAPATMAEYNKRIRADRIARTGPSSGPGSSSWPIGSSAATTTGWRRTTASRVWHRSG